MKITINHDSCLKCGSCVALCPNTFSFGADGNVQVADPIPDPTDTVKNTALMCPGQAMTVEE